MNAPVPRQSEPRKPWPAELPDGRPCEQCGERKASTWFDDSGVAFHGFTRAWCEPCVLRIQIPYARDAARRLDGLEARYLVLTGTPFDESGGVG